MYVKYIQYVRNVHGESKLTQVASWTPQYCPLTVWYSTVYSTVKCTILCTILYTVLYSAYTMHAIIYDLYFLKIKKKTLETTIAKVLFPLEGGNQQYTVQYSVQYCKLYNTVYNTVHCTVQCVYSALYTVQ